MSFIGFGIVHAMVGGNLCEGEDVGTFLLNILAIRTLAMDHPLHSIIK
jgi:hypothetical protein